MEKTVENAIEVSPSRLEHGTWCHKRNRTIGEGDIAASYSADRIGSEMPIRKPFSHAGALWVAGGTCGASARAYRLVHPSLFDGETFTYGERVADGNRGRRSKEGFYHGMKVTHRGEIMVMCGPEITFVAGLERQGDLFASDDA